MRIDNGTYCPLLKKECIALKCAWFTKIVGFDTNTGKEVEDYQCAVAWLPMLLIENSGQQRQTGAAVESFRNEMVKSNETSQKVLLASLGFSNRTDHVLEIEPPKAKTVKPKNVRSK